MLQTSGNIFETIDGPAHDEQFTDLFATAGVRIERIVSTGQSNPENFWYDQDWSEWVILLTGAARLQFEGETEPRRLGPGDFIHIPPRVRHRVAWTDPAQPTVWLAIHLSENARPPAMNAA